MGDAEQDNTGNYRCRSVDNKWYRLDFRPDGNELAALSRGFEKDSITVPAKTEKAESKQHDDIHRYPTGHPGQNRFTVHYPHMSLLAGFSTQPGVINYTCR